MVSKSAGGEAFKNLLLASRAYGFTNEGVNQDSFSLTPLGEQAASGNKSLMRQALRSAVLKIDPFREFLTEYNNKRVPTAPAFKSWLSDSAKVPAEWAEECMDHILEDARLAGFIKRDHTGGEYVDLDDDTENVSENDEEETRDSNLGLEKPTEDKSPEHERKNEQDDSTGTTPKKVFIGHGKSKGPLNQLKEILTELGVDHSIAVDEANAGRPIGEKVANIMQQDCSSAIFIHSADELFFSRNEQGEFVEVWRPSENAVYELGAASVLYRNRIILYKEDKVQLPTDYRDLGHIKFENGNVSSTIMQLLRELKALGMVELRVTG
jgi:predicted nucleotide-binding protein